MASHSKCNSALLPRRILNPLRPKDSNPLQIKDSTAMRLEDSTPVHLKEDSTTRQLNDSKDATTCLLKGFPIVPSSRNSTAVFNSRETNSTLVNLLNMHKNVSKPNSQEAPLFPSQPDKSLSLPTPRPVMGSMKAQQGHHQCQQDYERQKWGGGGGEHRPEISKKPPPGLVPEGRLELYKK